MVKCRPYEGSYHVSSGGKLPEGKGPTGWRGYKPGLWRQLYECCSVVNEDFREADRCQRWVRKDYRLWENGRIHESLDRFHNALIRFDGDELKDFGSKNPGVIQMVNEWAVIEEVARVLE